MKEDHLLYHPLVLLQEQQLLHCPLPPCQQVQHRVVEDNCSMENYQVKAGIFRGKKLTDQYLDSRLLEPKVRQHLDNSFYKEAPLSNLKE